MINHLMPSIKKRRVRFTVPALRAVASSFLYLYCARTDASAQGSPDLNRLSLAQAASIALEKNPKIIQHNEHLLQKKFENFAVLLLKLQPHS